MCVSFVKQFIFSTPVNLFSNHKSIKLKKKLHLIAFFLTTASVRPQEPITDA
jgi:hypothetical protein